MIYKLIGSFAGIVGIKELVRSFLNDFLPDDISLIQNKCLIWYTILPCFKRENKCVFKSKHQLTDILLGCVYIPVSHFSNIIYS